MREKLEGNYKLNKGQNGGKITMSNYETKNIGDQMNIIINNQHYIKPNLNDVK